MAVALLAPDTVRANLESLRADRRHAWLPPPALTLSQWADLNFRLPEGDANAGRWTTLPYQRQILDAMTDSRIERVTLMKSSRLGFTRGLCAAVGFWIEHDPSPILIVQPTIDDAKKHSREDLKPMFRDVPVLRRLVWGTAPTARNVAANTILQTDFPGGSLLLVGATSGRGFRRTSRRVVIFDEVDAYDQSVVGDEGDPISLGIRRTETYWNRKIILGSTPTVAARSRIERSFRGGDQRRYWVPCPHCGAYQVLRLENMRWPKEPKERPEDAVFVCTENGCVIEHRSKRAMVEAGEWRPDAPENFTPANRHASFHIWAAYSYSANATWGQIAQEYVAAVRGGALTHRTFANTVEGRTWVDFAETMDWEVLYRRREDYAIGTVPRGALFLTAGVDVQKDHLVVEVVGWGRGRTSWSVDFFALTGDTANLTAGPWPELAALLERTFPHEAGVEMPISKMAVDSGYNTQTVYAWCRQYPITRVIAVKGEQSRTGPLVSAPTTVDVSDRGRKIKHPYRKFSVATSAAKDELSGFLRLQEPTDGSALPPGFMHFPAYGEEYFRQLTAEQLLPIRTRRGQNRYEWTPIPGRICDGLDCRVYARAAAFVFGLDRFRERDWVALEAATGQAPGATAPPPTPPQAEVTPAAPLITTTTTDAPAMTGPAPPASAPPPEPVRIQRWIRSRPGWLRRR